MELRFFKGIILIFSLMFILLSGCPKAVWVSKEPPLPLENFLSSKWGDDVDGVKKAIERDGNQWFKDETQKLPYSLYAFGRYMDQPAIFSYFFTPKSKKLYRVDVTFNDLKIYEKVKDNLIQKYKSPSFSQTDIDHWSWDNKSLLILQKDSTHIQISYSSGPFSILNHKERGGFIF